MIEFVIAGFILGVALTIGIYETKAGMKGDKIQKLLSKKMSLLLQESSMRIGERQKILKRELTENEKNKILDECYEEYK